MHNYKILIEVCLLYCICAFQYDAHAIEIKTLSFNILTSGKTLDCCGKWDDRKSSVLQLLKEIAGNNPVIVLGDFNATENKTPITSIINERDLIDTYRYIHLIRDKNSVLGSSERIDFIFVSKHFNVMNADINQSKTIGEQKHLSDHYPISATLSTLNIGGIINYLLDDGEHTISNPIINEVFD